MKYWVGEIIFTQILVGYFCENQSYNDLEDQETN